MAHAGARLGGRRSGRRGVPGLAGAAVNPRLPGEAARNGLGSWCGVRWSPETGRDGLCLPGRSVSARGVVVLTHLTGLASPVGCGTRRGFEAPSAFPGSHFGPRNQLLS